MSIKARSSGPQTLSYISVLQISTLVTAFLLDQYDPTRIVTYDWKSKIYAEKPERLIASRSSGQCAAIRQYRQGPLLVAAAGILALMSQEIKA